MNDVIWKSCVEKSHYKPIKEQIMDNDCVLINIRTNTITQVHNKVYNTE